MANEKCRSWATDHVVFFVVFFTIVYIVCQFISMLNSDTAYCSVLVAVFFF